MTPLVRGAEELRELVDRFTSLSQVAMHACEDRDEEALSGTLDARAIVCDRLEQLASQVQALRLGASRTDRSRADAILGQARASAHDASAMNAVLLQRADDFRRDVGRQVELLRRDHEATTAYHATGTRPPALDETR